MIGKIKVTTRPYDTGDEVNDILMRYENLTTKIRTYFERGFYYQFMHPTRRTPVQHAAAALDRADKAYRALAAILKPTLEGWKKR